MSALYKKNPINMFYFPNRRRSEWDKEGGALLKGKISCHLFLQVVYRSPVTSETLPDYNVESAQNSDHVTQGTMGILGTTDRGGGTTPHTTTPGSALDTDQPWYKGRSFINNFFFFRKSRFCQFYYDFNGNIYLTFLFILLIHEKLLNSLIPIKI